MCHVRGCSPQVRTARPNHQCVNASGNAGFTLPGGHSVKKCMAVAASDIVLVLEQSGGVGWGTPRGLGIWPGGLGAIHLLPPTGVPLSISSIADLGMSNRFPIRRTGILPVLIAPYTEFLLRPSMYAASSTVTVCRIADTCSQVRYAFIRFIHNQSMIECTSA